MHTGHEPSSLRRSPSDCGNRICVSLLLFRPERAAHVSLGQRPRKTGRRNQSPEGANHGRLLNRWCGSRCAVYTVMPVCRTSGHWAPLQGSGSIRCLPGALPQANLCCPVGAKSPAWRAAHKSRTYVMGSWRDPFSGPEMHTGHEPARAVSRGDAEDAEERARSSAPSTNSTEAGFTTPDVRIFALKSSLRVLRVSA
jgi:hypothetical protein